MQLESKVVTFVDSTHEEVEKMLNDYLNQRYAIQTSELTFKHSENNELLITGLYVFIKEHGFMTDMAHVTED